MSEVWEVLGLEPTGDRAAIRRAYATRLKVANPEDDPEGFQALRAAYDAALAQAAWRARQAPPQDLVVAEVEAPPVQAARQRMQAVWRPPPEPVAADPGAQALDAGQAHRAACARLAGLLTGETEPPVYELRHALNDALTPNALEDIVAHLQTETWLAQLICHSAPRSDAILEAAAAVFGWRDDASYTKDRAVAQVQQRLALLASTEKFRRLEAVLSAPQPPGENALFAALDEVTSPRLAKDPAHGPQVGLWLARLLLRTRPRADPLLPIVVNRLGWARYPREGGDPAMLEVVQLATPTLAVTARARAARRSGRSQMDPFTRRIALIGLVLCAGILPTCARMLSSPSYQPPAYSGGAPTVVSGDGYSPGADDPGAAAPPDSSPDVTVVGANIVTQGPDAPKVQLQPDRIDISIRSSEDGEVDMSCTGTGARLDLCRTQNPGTSREGEIARDVALHLRYAPGPQAPAEGAWVPVRVRFVGV